MPRLLILHANHSVWIKKPARDLPSPPPNPLPFRPTRGYIVVGVGRECKPRKIVDPAPLPHFPRVPLGAGGIPRLSSRLCCVWSGQQSPALRCVWGDRIRRVALAHLLPALLFLECSQVDRFYDGSITLCGVCVPMRVAGGSLSSAHPDG